MNCSTSWGLIIMRNAWRIDPFCSYLAEVWKEHFPDWRFGQLISNLITFAGFDPFYMEDDKFKILIDKFVEKYVYNVKSI